MNSYQLVIKKHETQIQERRHEVREEDQKLAALMRVLEARIQARQGVSQTFARLEYPATKPGGPSCASEIKNPV